MWPGVESASIKSNEEHRAATRQNLPHSLAPDPYFSDPFQLQFSRDVCEALHSATTMSLSTLRFSLSRSLSPLHRLRPLAFVAPRLHSPSSQARTYAKKSKQKQDEPEAPSTSKKTKVSANDIIPGSQQAISDPTQAAEYEKCSSKMSTAVQWFRREVAQMETRASGRVTPQLLAPVRVKYGGESADGVRLEEVATVGVRDGSTLIVTVFETDVSVLFALHISSADHLFFPFTSRL